MSEDSAPQEELDIDLHRQDSARPRVAVAASVCFPPSQAAFAEELNALRRYSPVVLALSAPHPMGLPPEDVRSLNGLGVAARTLNHLAWSLSGAAPQLVTELRRCGCRLVHACSADDARLGLGLKARARVPLVISFQAADGARLSRRNPKALARLFAAGDLFLAPAAAVQRQLVDLGCPAERLRVHHPGVDLTRVPYRERRLDRGETVNVLLVGSLVERKGIPYALQAFAAVRRYQHRATLTIIGDGPQRQAIQAQVRELGLTEVRMLGAQPREVVLQELERAHVFVLPSITTAEGDCEGIPLALVEAQAAGLPVVTTWHSGISELVTEGHSGYLVSERDAHVLADRLRHLIEHPELWPAFGRAGRAVVERSFDLRRQARELEAYYDEVLDGQE